MVWCAVCACIVMLACLCTYVCAYVHVRVYLNLYTVCIGLLLISYNFFLAASMTTAPWTVIDTDSFVITNSWKVGHGGIIDPTAPALPMYHSSVPVPEAGVLVSCLCWYITISCLLLLS